MLGLMPTDDEVTGDQGLPGRGYFEVLGERGDGPVLAGGPMPDVTWFPGATLNYARNALRAALTDPARIAVIAHGEEGQLATLTYAELAAEVARVRAGLAALGVARGDRVAAFLPNIPAALIGLLATASLGAIWSSCSPDFGPHSVIDRFAQITPKVLLATGRYRYGGKEHDRRQSVEAIAAALPGRSATRCGCCTHPGPPACPRRSCTATAGSCSSI